MRSPDAQLAALALPKRNGTFRIPWPMPGRLDAILAFEHAEHWRSFVADLSLDDRVPQVVLAKYSRAQRVLLMAWIDPDLIKAAELVAMTALELALAERHAARHRRKAPRFSILLRELIERDGLSDDQIPMVARCGGSAIGRLTDEVHPSLREIRNSLAHGDPFDGLPVSGLIELARDIIEFAYRDYIAASAIQGHVNR